MNSEPKRRSDSLACATITDELNRYFTGKYMTARDFECDQAYFRSRNRLRNRLIGGWGVVAGLDVVKADQEDCPGWVEVTPGIAHDPLGRELIVKTGIRVKVDGDDPVALVLCYGEAAIEQVPALVGGASCDPDSQEMNRVREVAVVEAVAVPRLRPGMWSGHYPDGTRPSLEQGDAPGDDGYGLFLGEQAGKEVFSGDAVHFGVPIAYVWWQGDRHGGTGFKVSTLGRRDRCRDVTRISALSWRHGETLALTELKAAERILAAEFSGRLSTDPGPGLGIGPETFQVHYVDDSHRRHRVSFDPEFPPVLVAARKEGAGGGAQVTPADFVRAEFRIDSRQLDQLAGLTLIVTLKCDFIPDIHNRPVDGTHVGGTLPTGNGSPGGTFESWFQLGPDGPAASGGESS